MTLTKSSMLPLGTTAPDFTLPDTASGKTLSLNELESDKATVVMFICNHCPFVIHVRDELIHIANDYLPKGVSFIAISSNSIVTHPEDAPDKMKALAEQLHFPFPYLYDESQDIAKAYHAACTPDLFVFDGNMQCVYRGRLDDSTPGKDVPVTGSDLRAALDAVLSGAPVNPDQKPSMGCNIKWK